MNDDEALKARELFDKAVKELRELDTPLKAVLETGGYIAGLVDAAERTGEYTWALSLLPVLVGLTRARELLGDSIGYDHLFEVFETIKTKWNTPMMDMTEDEIGEEIQKRIQEAIGSQGFVKVFKVEASKRKQPDKSESKKVLN